jgi:hypothetical protein
MRALAVYMHFLTCLQPLEDEWYVGGMGRRGIEQKVVAMHKHEQREKLNVRNSALQIKFDWRTATLWPSEMVTLSRLFIDNDRH